MHVYSINAFGSRLGKLAAVYSCVLVSFMHVVFDPPLIYDKNLS
jgi:hypothetical protein